MTRRHQRWPCNLPASVAYRDRRQDVVIVDVNSNGARLFGLNGARADESLIVTCHGLRIEAWTRWTRGSLCGIEFKSSLEQIQLRKLLWQTEGDGAAAEQRATQRS